MSLRAGEQHERRGGEAEGEASHTAPSTAASGPTSREYEHVRLLESPALLLFGNAVARDAVLELGKVRVDGRTLHVRPRTYSGDAVAPRRQNNGHYAYGPKQQAYVDADGYAYHQPYYHQPRKPRYQQNYQNHPQHQPY